MMYRENATFLPSVRTKTVPIVRVAVSLVMPLTLYYKQHFPFNFTPLYISGGWMSQ